ncbi:MAG: Cof-type HAD-IIB family hydrolase [Oscillospiraceae bacterium]|jgi:Cof subfamily protein (haloacid dehalogenase superfamily)|nr:Cof-type HAD-IIB family hydrolase [Oscillospiraceae bacterium]
MPNIELIVTDLDNTLLRRDKTISGYTVSVFRRARERGVPIAFATGRPLSHVTRFSDVIKPQAMLLSNSSTIVINGEIVKEFVMPLDSVNAMLYELALSGKTTKIGARARDVYYNTKPVTDIENQVYHDFRTSIDDVITHLSFHTEDEAFALAILEKYPEFLHFRVSDDDLYDVALRGVTKASGIKYIADYFGISLSETAAFGDDWNDIEMLRECGVGVAVANAIDGCKAAADRICGDCDDDGVARWIEENVLSQQPAPPTER